MSSSSRISTETWLLRWQQEAEWRQVLLPRPENRQPRYIRRSQLLLGTGPKELLLVSGPSYWRQREDRVIHWSGAVTIQLWLSASATLRQPSKGWWSPPCGALLSKRDWSTKHSAQWSSRSETACWRANGSRLTEKRRQHKQFFHGTKWRKCWQNSMETQEVFAIPNQEASTVAHALLTTYSADSGSRQSCSDQDRNFESLLMQGVGAPGNQGTNHPSAPAVRVR
jgi:hypothetical protein